MPLETAFPTFRYHPDPVATGSITASDSECICCKSARGFIYVGPVYARRELNEQLCPWCIASGQAHKKYGAEFVDPELIGGGKWDSVSVAVAEEISRRTPGFCGWQQERWWTHCGDGAEFLGKVGREGAEEAGAEFGAAIRADAGLVGNPEWEQFFASLDRDRGPTAYAFRCLHCGQFGGYQDSH